jgi:hypothetical protein
MPNSYYARKSKNGQLCVPLEIHCLNATLRLETLWSFDKGRLLWALKTLGKESNEVEGFKILKDLVFIHDSGKHWSEWQNALKEGNTSILPHDVMGSISFLSLIGLFEPSKTVYANAISEIAPFIKKNANELLCACKDNRLLSLSASLTIALHHCHNISFLPQWLEENRKSPELAEIIKKQITVWSELSEHHHDKEVCLGALCCILSLIVECDWYAVQKELEQYCKD